MERTAAPSLHPVSVSRALVPFLAAGLVVVAAIAVVLAVAERHSATSEAIRDARTLTNLEATDVIGPALLDQALHSTAAFQQLDRVVRQRVLGSHIIRVKIWDPSGRIVYSDDTRLLGLQFRLPPDERTALDSGRTVAEVSKLGSAENRDEKQFGQLLQVYLGVRTPSGQRLLFETYQPYQVILDSSRRMWLTSLPVLLGGLFLLYVVQLPLAYRMASRLRHSQEDRELLLVSSLAASDRERATIAADLHDGVVQGLAGASYSLSATAERLRPAQPAAADTLGSTAADLRRWVRELRSLVVTIIPPALHAQGLGASLRDLGATLEVRGVAVRTQVSGTEGVDETSETLLYRAAQEAVRNIVRHAEARSVEISLTRERGSGGDELVLRVTDDGKGLDPDLRADRRQGSVGLDLLARLATAHGGSLEVGPGPAGGGTQLVMHLPAATP